MKKKVTDEMGAHRDNFGIERGGERLKINVIIIYLN